MLVDIVRHPVKSMLGEHLTEAVVSERGIEGDRGWAVLDVESGLVASAKEPRKWGVLLTAAARADDGDVDVVLPDGTVVPRDAASRDERLSHFVGREVRLVRAADASRTLERRDPDLPALLDAGELRIAERVDRSTLAKAAPAGTVFDYAAIHLVVSATLGALGVEAARFRPNLVVDLPGRPFCENDFAGRVVRVGSEVVLRVLVPTPRCVVPSLRHGDLPASREPLRAVARHNTPVLEGRGRRPCAGAYAEVLEAGTIRAGDPVEVV